MNCRGPLITEYMYIWEYVVSPDHVGAFENAYGPDGEWVQLFRRTPGYGRTELHRDRADGRRFITIDYWESESAWQAFRAKFAAEFEALDTRCEMLTLQSVRLADSSGPIDAPRP